MISLKMEGIQDKVNTLISNNKHQLETLDLVLSLGITLPLVHEFRQLTQVIITVLYFCSCGSYSWFDLIFRLTTIFITNFDQRLMEQPFMASIFPTFLVIIALLETSRESSLITGLSEHYCERVVLK